eukprot:TRINITY_DN2534_c0_g1_i1.p1 TRINITY_DN2534_c0_g1~~TRINITY_DN2534_c0_g1_i1.p1  ORF type:complete len:480 (+),score=37.67 TRINITY_DN2534_c0_g1_i1:107-1441(+)
MVDSKVLEADVCGIQPTTSKLPTLLESMRGGFCGEPCMLRKPKIEIAIIDAADSERAAMDETVSASTQDSLKMLGSPVHFQVRNTFIDMGPSSDEVSKGRAVRSCPGKHVGLLKKTLASLESADVVPETAQVDDSKLVRKPKPVLLLVDALGGEGSQMPSTPESISIPLCYGRGGYCEAGFTNAGSSSLAPAKAIVENTSWEHTWEPPAVRSSDVHDNVLATLCPEWLQSRPSQTQTACGVLRENHVDSLPDAVSMLPWLQDSSMCADFAQTDFSLQTQAEWNMYPQETAFQVESTICAQDSAFGMHGVMQSNVTSSMMDPMLMQPELQMHTHEPSFGFQGIPQSSVPSRVVAGPPEPPSFHAPVSVSDFATFDPPVPSQSAPGTEEMPSIGSAEHAFGECKPCAFLYTKGCENGALCKFCHICGPGEKKRRQKEKKLSRRGGA